MPRIPNLPAELRPMLRRAGFRVVRQAPVTIVNASYHENSFAYWAARLIVAFCLARNMIAKEEADAWMGSLVGSPGCRPVLLQLHADRDHRGCCVIRPGPPSDLASGQMISSVLSSVSP